MCKNYTLEVVTAVSRKKYNVDNSGKSDVASILQDVFDETAELSKNSDGGANYLFSQGIYFVNQPLEICHANVKISGTGHSGIDIHGINIAGGTCFHFGPECFPACMTFSGGGVKKSFPAGEDDWELQCARAEITGITFAGHNNTDVDTASGYSRMRGDKPNFRKLKWYPVDGRYEDVERDGQRAIVLKKVSDKCKPEMLKIFDCCFTDLYVGVDIDVCDVTTISHCWFAQLVYGIRNQGPGQATNISNTCFADLETGVSLEYMSMSALHHNSFAYVSKCFTLGEVYHSTITGNVLNNWHASTGAAACGAFCCISGPARNVTITANSVFQEHDSRTKSLTTDNAPNGSGFIQFEKCSNLLFSSNVIDTLITESIIRLYDCENCRITDNIITHGAHGSAVEQSENCRNIITR